MTLEYTYNRDAKTKLYTGISHQLATILASSYSSDSRARAHKGHATLRSG